MIPNELAIILLASGLSKRFGTSDKLLADLNGRPLGSYAASLFASQRTELHCAVVPAQDKQRIELYQDHGWKILTNPAPERGQGTSLAIAAKHLQASSATAALILLADMPFVTEDDIGALIRATPADHASLSQCGDTLQPPAIFPRNTFAQLAACTGDTGARHVFKQLPRTKICSISSRSAHDIDTPRALAEAAESQRHA